uniref:Organic cation transporter protein-like n=1 Tax=Phallusia mammillata TaxID=59560 RepID=A0A6F9DT39_9ASCI|nr:organic cation transporter protein-like [Phallusia mammillata]
MIDFDLVLQAIGGRAWSYQCFLTMIMFWNAIPFGMHTLAPVFYSAPVQFRCNDSATLNFSTTVRDSCKRRCETSDYGDLCIQNTTTCQEFEFESSYFTNTIIMEYSLVCDKQVFLAITTSMYMAGMWIGSILFGYISDRFGRKCALMLASIGCLVSSLCLYFANNVWLFMSIRLLVGAFCYPIFMISFIYVMEINYKHRTVCGLLMHVPFAIGHAINSLIAYYFTSWRKFNTVISLFFAPCVLFNLLVPESPRWLFSHNKNKSGIKIARTFFKKANMEPDSSIWEKTTRNNTLGNASQRQYSSFDLFKPRRMRNVTLKVMCIWFSSSLLFYGLSLNVGSLYGNIFINNALNAGVEVLVSLFIIAIFERVGRRILLSVSIIWAGVGCIANGILNLTSHDKERAYVSLFGKIGAAAAFHILYNFTAELYPTVVRSNGVGMGSMSARIGSICTPFLIRMYFKVGFIPDFVYAAVSLTAGILAVTLPETSGTKLCQTITEAEIMYLRSKSRQKHCHDGEETGL